MSKDYYETLGVAKGATQDEIKQAYRKLAHQYHPDKASGNEAKFKEVNEAYQVLKDQDKRAKYDQYGASFEQMGGWQGTAGAPWEDIMRGFKQGRSQGGFGFQGAESSFSSFTFDLGDIFNEFFGGSQFSQNNGQTRRHSTGCDIEVELAILFDESQKGTEKIISFEKFDVCAHCQGNKAEPGTPIVTCTKCKGTGSVTHTQRTFLGVMQSTAPCGQCNGEGKIPQKKCTRCKGDGMERVEKKLKVKIPAGIADGETIRIQKEGEISSDLRRSGDMYVHIHVEEDHKFNRKGDDLYSKEPISYTQAVLGGKILVDTIDGKVELKIPPCTESGTIFKLAKKGITHLRSSGRGDHYVTVIISVPKNTSRRGRQILQELAQEGL